VGIKAGISGFVMRGLVGAFSYFLAGAGLCGSDMQQMTEDYNLPEVIWQYAVEGYTLGFGIGYTFGRLGIGGVGAIAAELAFMALDSYSLYSYYQKTGEINWCDVAAMLIDLGSLAHDTRGGGGLGGSSSGGGGGYGGSSGGGSGPNRGPDRGPGSGTGPGYGPDRGPGGGNDGPSHRPPVDPTHRPDNGGSGRGPSGGSGSGSGSGSGVDPNNNTLDPVRGDDGSTGDGHSRDYEDSNQNGNDADEDGRRRNNHFCYSSFSADTTVVTPAGNISISELVEGDIVYAYSEDTGTTGEYEVTDTWEHIDTLVYLTIDGELIETTADHPFYTVEGEWLAVEELEIGDEIRRADGTHGRVEAITFTDTLQPMYNLTVDEAHTYFVGIGHWMVHNCTLDQKYSNVTPNRQPPNFFDRSAGPGRLEEIPAYQLDWNWTERTKKTYGILEVPGQGDVYLQSGDGPPSNLITSMPGRNNIIRTHVEAHVAAVMRIEGIDSATLYINQTPCPGVTGCNAMLERMLPEGATLLVIAPGGFQQRYTGISDPK
jgi:hypothetical protein